jgi:hypothetical protein
LLHTVKATRLAAYGGISQEQESKMSLDETWRRERGIVRRQIVIDCGIYDPEKQLLMPTMERRMQTWQRPFLQPSPMQRSG